MSLYNLEMEQAVLGNLLMYPDIAPLSISCFENDDFYHPLHALIFLTICQLIQEGKTANPLTVHEKIQHEPEYEKEHGYLARLAANPGIGSMSQYASILHDLQRKRLLQESCQRALQLIETDSDADDVLHVLDEARLEATSGHKMKTEKQVMEEIASDLKADFKPISTGMPRFDEAIDGGFFPRRAYAILARKKMGKTMMAATIAKNISDGGNPVLFIAAEMGDKEIQERVACRMMDVYGNSFRSSYRNSTDFTKRFAEAIGKSSQNLIYAKAPGIRFDALRQLIMAAKVRHHISGFVLDYWQLVGGKDGRASEREHLDTVAQWLADFARENDLWCLVMGQENQDGNSRGGEGIRLAFDIVFSLCGEPEESTDRWLVMKDTRYTGWNDVGSEANPAYRISEKGTHIEELPASTGAIYSMEQA